MSETYDVIVVGAGITGASAAYWLAKKGVKRVLLLETGPGPACSNTGKSAAIVRTFYTVPVMARLAKEAVELFEGLSEELGHDGGFRQTGFTQLLPPDWVETGREKVAMHQALGVNTVMVDPAEYGQRFPWLNPDGVGAVVFEERSGYADPVQTTEAFADAFVRLGGEVRYRTPARALQRDGNRITGVLLDDGPISAGGVINAAGPWAAFLARSVDLELPIRAVREQDTIWEVRPDRVYPDTPVGNAVDAVYMRPMEKGRWLLGRGFPKPYSDVDPYNYKETADEDFSLDLIERWTHRIPALQGARLMGGYAALYDVTPDWIPFMGPREGLEGYYDAAGGSGHAFKTGPIFTRELVDWIVDGTVREDFRQFSFDRVAAGNMFQQSFGGNRV